jgi:hypothetical protein
MIFISWKLPTFFYLKYLLNIYFGSNNVLYTLYKSAHFILATVMEGGWS